MNKRFLSIALALALLLAFVPAVTAPVVAADTFTPVTGWDMMKKLGVGITFANTTEARYWPWTDATTVGPEICWGQPLIEQWHLESAALKGFDSYRLCVSWTPHMDENYNIDPAWMNRIQEVVDWALDAGLNVVMNTHHEEELYWLIRDGEYDAAKKHLTALWTQVAERFKGYSEDLVFEIMNEPNLLEHYQGNGEWITENGQISQKLCDTVSKLNADALKVIRNSGGNNDKRVVMICLPGAHAVTIPYMDIPDDPYIIVGAFGYEGGFFNDNEITPIIQKLLNSGIGFVNKEDNIAANPKDHYKKLADMGVPSFYFTGGAAKHEEGQLIDRVTGQWIDTPILDALLAAYGKTPGGNLQPPAPAFPYDLKGSFLDKQYTTWTPPQRLLAAAEKLVIEYTGEIWWYKFSRSNPYLQYEIGDERITEVPGRIIFDLRGLEGDTLGFLTWNDGDAAKIKRAYLIGPMDTLASWAELDVCSAIFTGLVPVGLQAKYAQTITRAEYCAVTVSLYEKITGKPITERKEFSDDRGDVNIQKLYALGIVSGSGGLFRPDGEFSRTEVAAMTVKLLAKLGSPLPAASPTFADNASIPAWALASVGQVQAATLMGGVGNNRFGPTVKYDRQSAIMMALKLYNYLQ